MPEKFAAYGFTLEIPESWRIEFNSKNTREKGDVAFHSPANNVFFLSWGNLEDAKRRFKTLEDHRDDGVRRIRRNPNIQKAEITISSRQDVSHHEGILSKVVAQKRPGFMSRREPAHDVWSVHFYCPEAGRYYVAYWNINAADEFQDPDSRFMSIVRSINCHP